MNTHDGFPYTFNSKACMSCGGRCCRGLRGYVWISMQELESLADSLGIDAADFAAQYVRQVDGRISLRERIINGEHFCCFLDPVERRCRIYPTRPEQCRRFPFWDEFKREYQELMMECPGVSRL